jgi:hypothetical protein
MFNSFRVFTRLSALTASFMAASFTAMPFTAVSLTAQETPDSLQVLPTVPADAFFPDGMTALDAPDTSMSPLIQNQASPDTLLTHLRSGGVPPDGIPAMTNPQIVGPEEAFYLSDDDLVLGVYLDGQARAYPHNLGWHHEIVNDRIGDRPISVTFCPLTSTGLVFAAADTTGTQIEFGVSGLLINSNLVLYDRSDQESLYPQMIFTGISGPHKGKRLQLLPVTETTWGLWKQLHPDTRIVQAGTGLERYDFALRHIYDDERYRNYPYGAYRNDHQAIMFMPTTAPLNFELPAKETVLGLVDNGQAKSYPFSRLPDGAVINDSLGTQPVLIIFSAPTQTAIPYSRHIEGRTLTFYAESSDDGLPLAFRDAETGSHWDMRGRATNGPMAGARLRQLPAYNSMWFAWAAYWTEAAVWAGEGIIDKPSE